MYMCKTWGTVKSPSFCADFWTCCAFSNINRKKYIPYYFLDTLLDSKTSDCVMNKILSQPRNVLNLHRTFIDLV